MKMLKKRVKTADSNLAGKRLDTALQTMLSPLSRSQIQKRIKSGLVRVNDKVVKTGYILNDHDKIMIIEHVKNDTLVAPQKVDILFEDKQLLVVDKPPQIVVHPSNGKISGNTVAEIFKSKIKRNTGQKLREGVVHRLDKDTSGVLILCKTPESYESLSEQFSKRSVKKSYITLLKGKVEPRHGVIESPISRHSIHRKKMSLSLSNKGKLAVTQYQVKRYYEIKQNKYASLVSVRILTGRTHQIRVHFQGIKHPVIGDSTYGIRSYNNQFKKQFGLNRQFLHAAEISFNHPISGKKITIKSPLSEDLETVMENLEKSKL